MFKKLLIIMMLTTSLFGQIEEVFTNFFKYSTVYAGFNLTSPMHQDDRYRLSMIDPETGLENWQTGEVQVVREKRELKPDYDKAFGIRKIARFHYEPKRGVKNAGVGGDWYKGMQDASPNEEATIGRVKGWEYLVKYMEHRRWDMKHQSSEFEIRYLADWFVLKLKYMDLGLEEIVYGQGDLRFRKVFINGGNSSFNVSFGIGARTHPVYGFAPTVIDSNWYTSSWWDFAEDEFGVDDRGYLGDTNGDEVGDGGIGIYDQTTGEYIGYVGWDYRWFDRNGNLMAMSDREFYQYHFPGLLEKWFGKQLRGLGNQREISVSLGLDWYQYTENFWIHAWGTLFPYHYGLDKYSYHNAVLWKEHQEDGKDPQKFEFGDKGTGIWYDYDFGAVIGFKLQDNLGFYVEGKYLNYWERPAYDIKVGLNYQFVGFGL